MSTRSREVLVIGAGIAGRTAARDLTLDGYDVAVLEARERIGGRIWTSHELSVPTDLGASWIHGFENSPWRGWRAATTSRSCAPTFPA